jgi:hypothetical protein
MSLDGGEVAADDCGVKTLDADVRVLVEEPQRRGFPPCVRASSLDVAVPAGELQEARDAVGVRFVRACLGHAQGRRDGIALDGGLERPPVLVAMFAGKCVLNVAEHGCGRCRGIGESQTFDRSGIPAANFLQPVFGERAEFVERGHRHLPSVVPAVRLLQAGRRLSCSTTDSGWNSLPRTGGAPARAPGTVAHPRVRVNALSRIALSRIADLWQRTY